MNCRARSVTLRDFCCQFQGEDRLVRLPQQQARRGSQPERGPQALARKREAAHLEEVDCEGAAKHPVRYGPRHVGVDAGADLHQLLHTLVEVLPQLRHQALLAGGQAQALRDLQVLHVSPALWLDRR